MDVLGVEADAETRCNHYRTNQDIIAIKFKCCQRYYSCFDCHEVLTEHPPQVWSKDEFGELAVLCGQCKSEIAITDYLSSNFLCPDCNAEFNSGCKNHYHLYFEI